MICIGVCDDEKEAVLFICEILNRVAENLEKQIVTFASGEELISYEGELDLLFLDIDMPQMDGIETGIQYRRLHRKCKIAMVTGRQDRMKEAFPIEAFRFITKPWIEDEIEEALLACVNQMLGQNSLSLFRDRRNYKIFQKDIQYIEAFDGYTEFVCKTNKYRKDISLRSLETELDERIFCKISRKDIVNLLHVTNYTKEFVVLGTYKVHISRRLYGSFVKKYEEFVRLYGND